MLFGDVMKPTHLKLAGHTIMWGGIVGIVLAGVYFASTYVMISHGGDEFALSRNLGTWGLGLIIGSFAAIVGGPALLIKANPRPKSS